MASQVAVICIAASGQISLEHIVLDSLGSQIPAPVFDCSLCGAKGTKVCRGIIVCDAFPQSSPRFEYYKVYYCNVHDPDHPVCSMPINIYTQAFLTRHYGWHYAEYTEEYRGSIYLVKYIKPPGLFSLTRWVGNGDPLVDADHNDVFYLKEEVTGLICHAQKCKKNHDAWNAGWLSWISYKLGFS